MQARLRRRTVRLDVGDPQRIGAGFDASPEPKRLRHFRNKNFRERIGHLFDGNGETDAVAFAVNRHVQSNQFAFQISERAAAAAGVDGGVGLQPVSHVQQLILQRRPTVL